MKKTLSPIREVAAAAGVTSQTIRRWEKSGVIEPAVRIGSGPKAQRYFTADALSRVRTTDAGRKPNE